MEEYGVNKIKGLIYMLYIGLMITSPLLVVDAYFVPAQTTTPTLSGELLPNPYFTDEPYVEIGLYSQEFSYEYSPGSLTLIWMHSAGYELNFGSYYPTTCNEFARVTQTFLSDYNESIQSVRLAATIQLDTTGDFSLAAFPDNMWEIHFGVYSGNGGFTPLRIVNDFDLGEVTELQYMLTSMETDAIFYGPETMRSYGFYIQLIPTYYFGLTIGNTTPWMDFSGSVVAQITHMSFEAMLEGESLAPPLKAPLYNTTLLQNETTSVILGIESAGYDQIYEMRQQDGPVYSLFTRTSDHQELRNYTIPFPEDSPAYFGIFSFSSQEDRIATVSIKAEIGNYSVRVECIDSFGDSLWNSTISLFYQDIPIMVDFDGSGNLWLHILSVDMAQDPYNPYSMTLIHSLAKLDDRGSFLWNKTLRKTPYYVYASSGDLGLPTGFGTEGNNIFIGFRDEIFKIDPNGEKIWSTKYDTEVMSVDPLGGFYSYSRVHLSHGQLTRWETNGDIAWTKSLGWDYGNGWVEEPLIRTMTTGPNGPLHLVLEYPSVDPCSTLVRITRAGDIISQDKIFEAQDYTYPYYEPYYYYGNLPVVTDIAVTGDGLVHLVGTHSYYPYINSPLYPIPGTFLITYQLPEIPTISPLSLGMIGVASVLIIGIAYDFFFRRRNIPAPPPEPSIADFEW